MSDDTNTAFLHNSKSFSKHLDDIVSNDRIVNNENYRIYRNTNQSIKF